MTVVGLLHPGEMGAAIGGALRARGETVLWASAGRSTATGKRAEQAGLEDVGETNVDARVIPASPAPPPRSRPPTRAGRREAPPCFSPFEHWRGPRPSRTRCSKSGGYRCRNSEERSRAAARSARRKGWRWIGEMEEIARSMAEHDLPTGFHRAAAEVFRGAAEGPGSR